MPPKARITREMIVDAAFTVVQKVGAEEINVRKIAAELKCSTQPVMYHFRTMEELKAEVYVKSSEYMSACILDGEEKNVPVLLERYIRFAREESNLFRFIFQTGRIDIENFGAVFGSSEDLRRIVRLFGEKHGLTEAQAHSAISTVFLVIHGYAALIANNCAVYDEKQCEELLNRVLIAFPDYWKTLDIPPMN